MLTKITDANKINTDDMRNPFTPTFGHVPKQMAGRREIIDSILDGYENGPGDPSLTTILIGARGTGKTSLLSYIANEASSEGWIAVNVSCVKGMMEDIYEQTIRKAEHLLDEETMGRLANLSVKANVGKIGAEIGLKFNENEKQLNWRSRITVIIEKLHSVGTGLLITVDEVNPKLDEMVEFASVYQLIAREEYRIALLMAGLPHNVSLLTKDASISFIRRANQIYLGRIEDYEIEDALKETARIGGKEMKDDAAKKAVKAIQGFPYMMQLVGYRAWEKAKDRDVINCEDVERGVSLAENDLKTRVLKATLDEASKKELELLKTMLPDEKFSSSADIAKRLSWDSAYVASYKKRLCDKGILVDISKGKFGFALPFLKEYIPEYLEMYCFEK